MYWYILLLAAEIAAGRQLLFSLPDGAWDMNVAHLNFHSGHCPAHSALLFLALPSSPLARSPLPRLFNSLYSKTSLVVAWALLENHGEGRVWYQALDATYGPSPASPHSFILLLYPAIISPALASTEAAE